MRKLYQVIPYITGIALLLFVSADSFSQDRCGTVEYSQHLLNKNKTQEDLPAFEEWIARRMTSSRLQAGKESTIRIPVVVHVIHKGEALGTGTNIPDAQIRSQIDVLNKDYNRLNADAINTPAEFLSAAGHINIEFVLARQTPDGQATTGILRAQGSKNQWTVNDDAQLKAISYWPAEDYLNLWVTDLSSDLLGYAQFPVSSTLSGLESAVNNRLTDGVVIDYLAFGSIDDGDFSLYTHYAKGRAATHEIGHFFGLRHIWGDDNGACGGSGDYVSDTPDQANSTSGCPSQPLTTCSQHAMFQNYMDYSYDDCMNLFTNGQASRMETVLANSPRRASLLTSHGLDDPQPAANDLALLEIVSPSDRICYNSLQPVVQVKNNGTNDIHDFTLAISEGSSVVETKTFSMTEALQPGQSTAIRFDSFSRNAGTYALSVEVIQTNNVTDAKMIDNKLSVATTVLNYTTLPVAETFDALSAQWTIPATADGVNWQTAVAPQINSTNKAAYINFYQSSSAGKTYQLQTPLIDLANAASPYLIFDVAYSRYPLKEDGLRISVLTDCEAEGGTEVYYKSGSDLSTTDARTSTAAFIPAGAYQWRREVISLRDFTGKGRIQVSFTGINGGGNNIYIDNVHIVDQLLENVAIKSVLRPAAVQCERETQATLLVENKGTVAITSLHVQYVLNDGTPQTVVPVVNPELLPGGTAEITLPPFTLEDAENEMKFVLTDPNGLVDLYPEDNTMAVITIVNTSADVIPLRENFESDQWSSSWQTANPQGDSTWRLIKAADNHSLYFSAVSTSPGDQAWLVSPVLNFSGTTTASVFFDVAYGCGSADCAGIKVYTSRDCGVTYDEVVYDEVNETYSSGSISRATNSMQPWQRKYINLNSLAGNDQARLAFVCTNAGGNDTYLDNIEFFVSDDPEPLALSEYYSLYGNQPGGSKEFYITFNLQQRQPVTYELMDTSGRLIKRSQLENVLNQTFEVNADDVSGGLYIVRLHLEGKHYSERIFLEGN